MRGEIVGSPQGNSVLAWVIAAVVSLLVIGALLVLLAPNPSEEVRQELEAVRTPDQRFQRKMEKALAECEQDPDCNNVPFGLADEPDP
ncbi:MAG: hypothetical protein HYW51_03870 [Candidatus Doudnabacteria bacterium]|nr:hypothetical protein [Candidatus Doudnabacteria bacterium]